MSERTLTVRLKAVVDGYERAMKAAGDATDQFAARADRVTGIGDRAEATGKRMTTGLTVPIAAIGTAALFTAGNYEASMREVQALTGATGAQMEQLGELATRMGAETQFGASDAADALGQLVKGGFDVGQAYEALPGVMQLAAAATLDIASAADIATNVMSGFGLGVGEMGRANDVLAQSANASDTDVRELGEAFKMVGPIARGAGMSLEETAGVLSMLAENGIRGTMAGTSLRGMIASLVNPTGPAAAAIERLGVSVTTASGELLPMTDIVEQFNRSGATTADIYAIFGREVAGGMTALLGTGAPALEQMTTLMEESGGVAQNLADAKMGGLNGSIEQLRGSLESLAIAFAQAGVSSTVEGISGAIAGLVAGLSQLPSGLLGGIAGFTALAAASGPAVWAFGAMTKLYRPVITGLQGIQLQAMIMGEAFTAARSAGMSTASALMTVFGPGAAVLAGVAALGAGVYFLKRSLDEAARSSVPATETALRLAEAAGIATRELGGLRDAIDDGSLTNEEWRRSMADDIKTLRELEGIELQQGHLMQVGFELVLQGATPEQSVDEVKQLARAAGIEIPAELTVEGVDSFDAMMAGISTKAEAFASTWSENMDQRIGRSGVKQLDEIAAAAALAFKSDNVEGFVQILAEAEGQLGSYSGAINYLADRVINDLSEGVDGGMGLSQRNASDLAGVMRELQSEASLASAEQKALFGDLERTAAAGDDVGASGLLAAAALGTVGYSAKELGVGANAAADGTDDLTAGLTDEQQAAEAAAAASQEFADRVAMLSSEASLARIDIDAASAAAEAFAQAIDDSTSTDNLLGAGLSAGASLRSLREGLYGSSDAAGELEESTEDTYTAVDRLGDVVGRLDEKLSAAGIRMGALQAAADGFRRSIENSTGFDNQLGSALSVGEAWRDFATTVRRLPADLDVAAAASGRYRTRQSAAIQSVIDMGNASKEYLATLLETGAGQNRVREESARMRAEFEQQLRQAGMNEDQIRRYVEVLGLTPAQVETAIKVSGEDAARFQIESYLQLLQDRIPDNIATSVVGAIEAGDLQGASAQLAAWARTNPVRVEVRPEVDGRPAAKAKDELWDLPATFDPVTAFLGGYSDAQQSALEGIMAVGDGTKEFLSLLVGQGEYQQARDLAAGMRDELGRMLAPLNLTGEQLEEYHRLLGITDDQVETAIVLSGDAEAIFRIQTYTQLLNDDIPDEVKSQVMALIDNGQLDWAAAVLQDWREKNGGNVATGADVAEGVAIIATWREDEHGNAILVPADADTAPGEQVIGQWRMNEEGQLVLVPVGADTDPAVLGMLGFLNDLAKLSPEVRIRVATDLSPEAQRLTSGSAALGGGGVGLFLNKDGSRDRDGNPNTLGVAAGGHITGPGSGTSDSIPARLSNGEFVMRAAATSAIGVDRLQHANLTGQLPAVGMPYASLTAPLSGMSSLNDGRIVDRLDRLEHTMAKARPNVTLNVPVETTDRPATMRDVIVQAKGVLYTEGLIDGGG